LILIKISPRLRYKHWLGLPVLLAVHGGFFTLAGVGNMWYNMIRLILPTMTVGNRTSIASNFDLEDHWVNTTTG